MSRGHGSIQRRIIEIIDADVSVSWTLMRLAAAVHDINVDELQESHDGPAHRTSVSNKVSTVRRAVRRLEAQRAVLVAYEPETRQRFDGRHKQRTVMIITSTRQRQTKRKRRTPVKRSDWQQLALDIE